MIIGGIEAGGTKFVCGVGNEKGEIFERVSFPTETPDITMKKVVDFFIDKNIEALGIGSFGPVDLKKDSSTYGHITKTPKLAWRDFDFIGYLKKFFSIPIYFDTDVNAAALGESKFGAAKGLHSCIYLTVGTGVGGGALLDGILVHGMLHPEMGHILTRRHPQDNFEGCCPYHKDCLEGMASGPALEKRWHKKGIELEADHIAWDFEAFYLAQALSNYILTLSPERIILGGGVMKQKQLFPKIREEVKKILAGYVQTKEILEDLDNYIVPPGLGDNAGLIGAITLATK